MSRALSWKQMQWPLVLSKGQQAKLNSESAELRAELKSLRERLAILENELKSLRNAEGEK